MGICGILQQPSYITGGSVGPSPGPGPSPSPGPSPAPGSEFYENPDINECQDSETALKLTYGRVCAPKCSADADCPGAPTGFKATPSCAVIDELTDQKYCLLSCVRGTSNDCGDSNADESHAGAQCGYHCQVTHGQWDCVNACMYENTEDITAKRINDLETES